jgi:DNA-directed RNA polymerase specialized sigma24 family protein
MVVAAGSGSNEAALKGLEALCRLYWFPLYVFARRKGHSPESSQDLVQWFLERFLEPGYFVAADPRRGRFRVFLLVSLKRFLATEWLDGNRPRREGVVPIVPLDLDEVESRYLDGPPDKLTPDRAYERRWAEILLDVVLARLRVEHETTGRSEVFDRLQPLLWGPHTEISFAALGRELKLSETVVKSTINRLRTRFRELLREEASHTVETRAQVDAELHHLLGGIVE